TWDGVFKYVSDHLIYEILLRTPAESLLVFKRVCKAWYSMIKDPNFANQHCDHHVTKEQSIGLVSLFEREGCYDNIYDVTNINKLCKTENAVGNLERQNEQLQLNTHAERSLKITSCNGLVCFHTEFPLHMWNPVTRELLTLPQPGIDYNKEVATGCGFGFDAIHNEYKVIQLYKRFDDSTLGYEVLALGTAMSWRRPIQHDKDVLLHPHFQEFESGQGAVFIEGSLYWHATKQILCFDVTAERFELIQIPDRTHLKLGWHCALLVGFDRSLCYINHDETHKMLHIWKMQKNCADKKNTWIKGCSIDVSCISVPDTYISPIYSRSKKIYLRYGKGLACYDAESHTFVKAVFKKGDADYFEFIAYTKSIVCMKDIVGSSFHVSSLEPNC
ncbi:hypothetical protein MKW92_005816, partial [Papaver armeniacum]